MYQDEMSTTEAVLRAYTDALADKERREEFLQGQVLGGGSERLHVQGGGGQANQGDRYAAATENDKRLERDKSIVFAVRQGMRELNGAEDRCIRAVFFENRKPIEAAVVVRLSVSYVRSSIQSGKAKLSDYCIPVYPLVCELRADLRAEREAVLKKDEEK